jgi:hypothetical protein
MKKAFPAFQRTLLGSANLLAAVFAQPAFGNQSTITILRDAPLSLPRLAVEAHKLGKKPVRGDAFEVLNLSPSQRAKQKMRGDAAYLEIEPDAEWQQKLRNRRAGANYVSFTLNGSLGTRIDIDGASFVIGQSEQDPAYAAIEAEGTDTTINHETPWLLFGGARMAAFNIVTVKVDRKAGTWAMWFRDMLVAVDMPISSQRGEAGRFQITAGKAGAWVCGLVCSDENPLFEDANDNTVPDDFEQEILGKLLSADAAEQSQAILKMAWREERMTRRPSEFVLTTPLPDNFPEDCAPEGQIVHGMTGGLKFGVSKKK